ncbi:MAG: chemotaxis protein CheD [Leptospiraceae bacterium]|nr:chemotaxis protein CheD [Leptospiraceae bacterium]
MAIVSVKEPDFVLDIFLQPGEFFWGDATTRIRTILGSCVAICIWHPELCVGGMSHSILPRRKNHENAGTGQEARYVDESVELFLKNIKKSGTRPADYHVKLFGGGSFFGDGESDRSVGSMNVATARELLEKHGFRIHKEHLGGMEGRNVLFHLWNGEVWMRRISITKR